MARSLIGARIRDRRRARGYTQSWLAARVEISPSYLNLIEGNKRNIGGALLGRIASELGLEIDEIDGAAERRLLSDLVELAGEPVLAELRLDSRSSGDLAARTTARAHAPVAAAELVALAPEAALRGLPEDVPLRGRATIEERLGADPR